MKQSKLDRQMDDQIKKAYAQSCSNISIDIMDIGRVFEIGRQALKNGATNEELAIVLREFVETIRKG